VGGGTGAGRTSASKGGGKERGWETLGAVARTRTEGCAASRGRGILCSVVGQARRWLRIWDDGPWHEEKSRKREEEGFVVFVRGLLWGPDGPLLNRNRRSCSFW